MIPESTSITLLVRKDAPIVDVKLGGLKVPLTYPDEFRDQICQIQETKNEMPEIRTVEQGGLANTYAISYGAANAILRPGNAPCAPRTHILASRLLDIVDHDWRIWGGSMAVVVEK